MRPNRLMYMTSSSGFTLLEVLTSMFLTSVVMTLIISSVMMLRDTYYTEIKRTQINGNLRSAMDIMSMNVRQAGEHLLAGFPAVLLTDGASGASDTLRLRKSPITEVLTLCADAAVGTTGLFVSSASLSNAECIPTNVDPIHTAFTTALAAEENKQIYVYDKSQKIGEFLNYTSSDTSSGQYMLIVEATSTAFTKLNTSIYIIEEYQFSNNEAESRLDLTINQESTEIRPVAFDVTNFQVTFLLQDGTSVSAFAQDGTKDWKDIHQIEMTLSGRASFKGQTLRSTITSKFFPRNVLSYEGG